MKRIIGVLLLFVSFFSFNIVVNAEEKINHYRVDINELTDKTGFTVKEIVEIQSDNQKEFYKYLSKNSSYLTMDRSYIKTTYDNLDAYSFTLEPTNTVTMSYDVKDVEDGYYVINFIPVRSSDEYSKLTYGDIIIVIYSSNPALDSENLVFEQGTYEVETNDYSIIAHITGEISDAPTFTYKVKKESINYSTEDTPKEEFNPFKKFCAMFFACEVVTFIAFMTLYTYCYVKREFLKFYMFLIYAVLEILFMLFCASLGAGEAFFIALFMHPFYSLFFIGFLFSKSSKRMNSVETLILILHSSAFLVLPAFGGAIGEGTYPLFGLVISSMMFYIALLLLADMYNHGNPFANNKPTPSNTKKVNVNGVEMFKSTVYKQYSKDNMYSNYKKFLGISPKHWFNAHYKEFSDSLFIWYMLIIVAIFAVLPAGYIIVLHIFYDIGKYNKSLMLDIIAFMIPFSIVLIIFLLIYIKLVKCWKFKRLYKNGTLIEDIPCRIVDFKSPFKTDGYYTYKIACIYSIDGEEKEYISNLKKEFVNNYPKTCDLLIDLDHPDNYYIEFAINRED